MDVPLPTSEVARRFRSIKSLELLLLAITLFSIDEDELAAGITPGSTRGGIVSSTKATKERLAFFGIFLPLNGLLFTVKRF